MGSKYTKDGWKCQHRTENMVVCFLWCACFLSATPTLWTCIVFFIVFYAYYDLSLTQSLCVWVTHNLNVASSSPLLDSMLRFCGMCGFLQANQPLRLCWHELWWAEEAAGCGQWRLLPWWGRLCLAQFWWTVGCWPGLWRWRLQNP